jgi:hypothetical protein
MDAQLLPRALEANHLAACERLYLVRRLQPWHRHEAKRLIKTPKLHFIDSGLAATLADLAPEDWHDRRDRFGHLLETFVLQQLVAQAGWTDSDLRRLAAQCGDDFFGGVLIHAGAHTVTLGDPRFLAMPLAKLWGM